MVVGHSVTRSGEVTTRFEGRLYRGDVGLGYGRDGRALIFESDGVSVLDPRTGELSVPAAEPAHGEGWAQSHIHLPDILIETILREGEVDNRPGLQLSGSDVIELSRGGLKMRALFKRFDPKAVSSSSPGARAQHELAAYVRSRCPRRSRASFSPERRDRASNSGRLSTHATRPGSRSPDSRPR
jgi:ribosome-associated protein YbcJ (S4-like RNA binding protein)